SVVLVGYEAVSANQKALDEQAWAIQAAASEATRWIAQHRLAPDQALDIAYGWVCSHTKIVEGFMGEKGRGYLVDPSPFLLPHPQPALADLKEALSASNAWVKGPVDRALCDRCVQATRMFGTPIDNNCFQNVLEVRFSDKARLRVETDDEHANGKSP